MPAGGPGDAPLIDILRWRRPVFSPRVDSLIAELAELWNAQRLESYLRDHDILWTKRLGSDLVAAEALLAAKRNELYEAANARAWDMQSMDARLEAQRQAVKEAWAGRVGPGRLDQ